MSDTPVGKGTDDETNECLAAGSKPERARVQICHDPPPTSASSLDPADRRRIIDTLVRQMTDAIRMSFDRIADEYAREFTDDLERKPFDRDGSRPG